MRRDQRHRYAGTAVILIVGLALWFLLRDKPTVPDARSTATPPSAEFEDPPPPSLNEESSVVGGFAATPDAAEVDWYAAMRSISPSDLRAREQRKDRRITTFFVQQRIEELGLEHQQSEQLRELLSRRFEFEREFRGRMNSEGVSVGSEEFEKRRLRERLAIDAQIEILVGAERVAEATRESHKVGLRLYAVEMAGEAALQGIPLTASQRAALNDRIAQIGGSGPRASPTDPADPRLGANLYDMKVFVALEGVLSKRQIEVLQDIKYEERLYQEAERRIESQKFGF